jgi:tetratricopeptide (TPR) repeat protein
MKLLIDKGANLEAQATQGFTPLFPAIQRGHLEAVQLLVSRGAQVNARCDCGATALFEAVKWGREDVAQYLLQHGANVNAKVDGQTALAFAEKRKMEGMADILRDFGGKTFKESEELVQRAADLFEGKQWDETIAVLTKGIELDPESVPAYSRRAATWIKKGELEKAAEDYRRTLQLSPTHFESHMNLSWIYAQREQWDLGIALWSNLIKAEPDNAQAYYERAHHAWYKKDHLLVREDLHRSCSLGYAQGCDMWKGGGGPPTS